VQAKYLGPQAEIAHENEAHYRNDSAGGGARIVCGRSDPAAAGSLVQCEVRCLRQRPVCRFGPRPACAVAAETRSAERTVIMSRNCAGGGTATPPLHPMLVFVGDRSVAMKVISVAAAISTMLVQAAFASDAENGRRIAESRCRGCHIIGMS